MSNTPEQPMEAPERKKTPFIKVDVTKLDVKLENELKKAGWEKSVDAEGKTNMLSQGEVLFDWVGQGEPKIEKSFKDKVVGGIEESISIDRSELEL